MCRNQKQTKYFHNFFVKTDKGSSHRKMTEREKAVSGNIENGINANHIENQKSRDMDKKLQRHRMYHKKMGTLKKLLGTERTSYVVGLTKRLMLMHI